MVEYLRITKTQKKSYQRVPNLDNNMNKTLSYFIILDIRRHRNIIKLIKTHLLQGVCFVYPSNA